MPTKILIDPWLFSFSAEELHSVIGELEPILADINDLPRDYPVTLAAFLSSDYVETITNDYRYYYGRNGGTFARLIVNIELQEAPVSAPAKILTQSVPGLDDNWLRVLADIGSNCRSPFWRNPVIIVSDLNERRWPDKNELQYSSEEDTRKRNLVQIRRKSEHPFFECDLDPWRVGAVGEPAQAVTGDVCERHLSRQRLPRPLDLLPLNLTFSEMVQILRHRIDWSCGQDGRAYYIPPLTWDPCTISQKRWRDGRIFPHEKSMRDGRRGPVDRDGRIWLWDIGENSHWDVQLPGGRHKNVSHDGKLLKQVHLSHFSEKTF